MTFRAIYQLINATKSYGSRCVLRVDHLEVGAGELLALVGPTGAGKSTLLRMLAGLESPTTGQVWFDGQAAASASLACRRRLTMVFQRPVLLARTVRANVEAGLRMRRVAPLAERVTPILQQLELLALARQSARSLSGGETQLVALARALVLETEVLLLDEPTAHLDPARVALVEKAVADVRQQRATTIVWATHNLFQARRMADRVAFLLDGQLVEASAKDDFFDRPRDPRSAAFVQGKMVY